MPISPVVHPSTVTLARLTRCTTARIGFWLKLQFHGHGSARHHKTCATFDPGNGQPLGFRSVIPKLQAAVPEEPRPFLYTNSPRQLHYTLAFFLKGFPRWRPMKSRLQRK